MTSSADSQPAEATAQRQPARAARSPWRRPRDRVAVAVIVVCCLVAAFLVWLTSDERATSSATAAQPPPLPAAPVGVPGALKELWQADSAAAPVPVGEGNTVITASGGAVTGRDPMTGAPRWHYTRDLPLCTVAGTFGRALALYSKGTNCSEVTQLDPGTGERTAQRNGDAELGTRLLDDGGRVTTTGTNLLNTWRDDLVKTAEYGQVPALVNAKKQPRTGCRYGSVAVSAGRVGVIERCPDQTADRLTVFKAGKDADEPQVVFSPVLDAPAAKIIAMAGDSVAVALPTKKTLVIYGSDGNPRRAYPLTVPDADLAADPPGGAASVATAADNIYWFTGSQTIALSRKDLSPQWTRTGTRGVGTVYAGQLVVPNATGFDVLNEKDGALLRTVAVDRHGYQGEVRPAGIGPVLLEQRGTALAALG